MVQEILERIRAEYEEVRHVLLGEGQISGNREIGQPICNLYDKLSGISHNRCDDSPDANAESYIVGKSRVLMFIWGQSPGFGSHVGDNIGLPGLCEGALKYRASEFCNFLRRLDSMVVE